MSLVVVGANGAEDPTSEESMMKGQSGKVQGIIKPPPDIRAVVDKTAQFVAKHGKEFEQKIIEKASTGDSNSSKFNFMRAHDPYNSYYEFKIKEFEENGGVAPPKPPPKPEENEQPPAEAAPTSEATTSTGIVRKQKMNPIALALTKKTDGKPHPPSFSLVHPTGLSAMDIDIIKLSAQYTAVSGRNFLGGLAQREQRNPQFDFLKPTHVLFSYFTSLVDAYSKVLMTSEEQKNKIENSSREAILERVVERWSYERKERDKRERERADTDKMQQMYMSVDWHDFVLVETIDFPEDEILDSSAPNPLAPPAATRVDEAMDMDMEEDVAKPQHVPVTLDDEDQITVVRNYKPDVSSNKAGPAPEMIDPITGRSVPVSEMSEHMRISLLDPKWRLEQQRLKEKTAQETMAEGGSIASALQSFAKQRGDIFGSTEEEEEAVLRERAGESHQGNDSDKLVWDGTSASAAAVQAQSLTRLMEQQHTHLQSKLPPPSQPTQTAPSQIPEAPRLPAPPLPMPAIPAQLRAPTMAMPPIPAALSNPPPQLLPPNLPPTMNLPPPSLPYPPSTMGAPPADSEAADEGPASKRPRVDPGTGLMSESDYANSITLPLEIVFMIPNELAEGVGQVTLSFDDVLISVKDVKDRLSSGSLNGLAVNKFQLKSNSIGFLKDRLSVAHYNIKHQEVIEVSRKKR